MTIISSLKQHRLIVFLTILSVVVLYILILQFRILKELSSLSDDVSSIDTDVSSMNDTVNNIDNQVSGLNP